MTKFYDAVSRVEPLLKGLQAVPAASNVKVEVRFLSSAANLLGSDVGLQCLLE